MCAICINSVNAAVFLDDCNDVNLRDVWRYRLYCKRTVDCIAGSLHFVDI